MNEPKIGVSMLYCLGDSFNKMIENLHKTETKYVEIVDDGLHALDKRRVATLKDVSTSLGLKYSVHAPFTDINIASPSNSMLKAGINRMKRSMACANALDAYLWVFHPGVKTGISMFYPHKDWIQNLKTVRNLVDIAKDYGVTIAIENVPEPYPFLMKSAEDFTRFYAELDTDVGMVLDVGHANINAQIEEFLNLFSRKIVHMHLSDNNGESDQHLGIGYGTVSWERFSNTLRRIRYDKSLIVESVEHVQESAQKLRQMIS